MERGALEAPTRTGKAESDTKIAARPQGNVKTIQEGFHLDRQNKSREVT